MGNELEVDEEMGPGPELNRITGQIIGAAIEVHRQLGPGLLESVYENALAIEMTSRNIPFERQVVIVVSYKGHEIGEARLDFVVSKRVIVELKSVESLAAIHTAQLIGYLKITSYKLGLLINFNVRVLKDGIKRIAN
jgi:GxxExxY protein